MYQMIEKLGAGSIASIQEMGRLGIFLMATFKSLFGRPFGIQELIKQVSFIGARSMPIILLSGLFTGMVLALQFYDVLARFGSVDLMGSAVALSLIQELGPVMTALMIIARVGSASCAEIAIMRNEQQFDALECMAINPYRYVMAPRLLAALISVPLLTAVFNVIGIMGGYMVGVLIKGVSGAAYLQSMIEAVVWSDVQMSLIKSILFALVIIWLALGKGYFVHLEKGVSGAEAVSKVTTKAVVASAITMLFVDYIASSFLI